MTAPGGARDGRARLENGRVVRDRTAPGGRGFYDPRVAMPENVREFRSAEGYRHRVFNAGGWMVEALEAPGGGCVVTLNASSGERRVLTVDGSLDDATRAALEAVTR